VFERYDVVSENDRRARVVKLAGTVDAPQWWCAMGTAHSFGKLVARDGIEPPTLRFSVACSTN
jgi:hypothetical protein